MITSTGQNATLAADYTANDTQKDKSVLGKDDFMTLLLVELQNQDPTEPTDTATILTQTSQLASLESAENTNNALSSLSTSLAGSQEFTSIAAIGKMANLGSDAIIHDEGGSSTFELYFPTAIDSGIVDITDTNGNIIQTLILEKSEAGVQQFTWNGQDEVGNIADSGMYSISSQYTEPDDPTEAKHHVKMGLYPIESIKFNDGKALAKVGSNYVPIASIVEIY